MNTQFLNKKVSKKWFAIIIILGSLSGLVTAQNVLLSNTYKAPQTAHVDSTFTLTITLDGVAWTNNTAIDWGTVTPNSTPTKTIIFTNTGTVPISTISLVISGLPIGWIEAMPSLTTALNPGQQATGTIQLTVPNNAIAGDYSWNGIVTTSQ
jgi:uncharacterized membrane protein